MSDLRLNTADPDNHDLTLTDGNITLVLDDEAVAQNLKIRLMFFFEEFFYDQRLGLPYFRDVLVKSPDIDLINSLFRTTIQETAGVATITQFSVNVDAAARTLILRFRVLLDSGTELVFEPLILDT